MIQNKDKETYMDNHDIQKRQSIEYMIKNSDMFLDADYERLASHIEGHRYFLGKNLSMPITWDEATYSWMSNIYQPISQVMENWATQLSFPGRRKADLFFEICDHQYFLSLQQQKEVDVYNAALDYDVQFGKTIGRIIAKILSSNNAA
ncbi:DUF4032 domain-containing protein [uncultured Sphaerochaeta sp.]|uniref:DUF4032 domain-containing protein n=1 Tax=uncultured Sphaerochaeta sp. TaxID=886478 RepID=UPI0029C9F5E2|nr:DUF4032 domain-containing protein [uncultured Sphaerochaeta sp.]MDY0244599.1 DUF4032 domain-containing protein [Sphaerochaeta sp.]